MRLGLSRWGGLSAALALVLPALAEGEPAKVRLKRYESLVKAAGAPTRIDAIKELRQADDPRIAELLLTRAFLDEDFRVAEAAVAFLARTATPAVADWLRENGAARDDARARFYTLRFLVSRGEPPAASVLEPFAADAEWLVRLEAAGALGRCHDVGAVPLLRRLLGDKAETVRCAAIVGLADHQAADALPEIRKSLSDGDWRVRSAALEAVVRLRDYEAVPLLTLAFEKETEVRMIDDLGQALDQLGAAKSQEKARALEAEAARPGAEGVEEARTHDPIGLDYGKRVRKDRKEVQGRIVFVLDCSQSMSDTVKEHPKPVKGGKGGEPGKDPKGYKVGGQGEPDRRDRPSDEEAMGYDRQKTGKPGREELFPPTRLGFAQRELCKAIRQIRPGISFNVICYQSAGKQKAWKQGLVPSSPGAIDDAVRFVKRQVPDGETATYDALVTALGFQEHDLFRPGAAWDPRTWPDTVLLLSDGTPTEGVIVQGEEIQASVRRLYRICRTRIHTVGVGRDNLPTLERIAEITGGRYVHIADEE